MPLFHCAQKTDLQGTDLLKDVDRFQIMNCIYHDKKKKMYKDGSGKSLNNLSDMNVFELSSSAVNVEIG